MKTFLLDSYNRYKRYSESLDVKTQLCNKTWVVFNDGEDRELYKFKEDGTIRIILSGRVSSGTWEYDPSDKSMIISASNQSIMVHPGMHEGILMGLQIDGTEECAFLIEENNSQSFAPKTRTELIEYFETKERNVIEAAKRNALIDQLEQIRKSKDRIEKAKAEEEKKKKEEQEKIIIDSFCQYLRSNGYHCSCYLNPSGCLYTIVFVLLLVLLVVCIIANIMFCIDIEQKYHHGKLDFIFSVLFFSCMILIIGGGFALGILEWLSRVRPGKDWDNYVDNFIKENADQMSKELKTSFGTKVASYSIDKRFLRS